MAEGLLINVDNGGTLTDVCVIDGERVHRTKTLTTPHDLAKCLLDGLAKASKLVLGREDVQALLLATAHLRYSTTKGTNALVERKGPRLGLIVGGTLDVKALRRDAARSELFDALVGERCVALDLALDAPRFEAAAVRAVNELAAAGASRLVVAIGGTESAPAERRLKALLIRAFPQHLLGAIPILYSHELVSDADDARRAWSALFNAFLHPAMERFLYRAEHKLADEKAQRPLLIFRNDGQAARVAKTIALKTYSSGPRGGAEGARALAAHYGFPRLLSVDVGGTTTDIGLVENGEIAEDASGHIEGVETSLPLARLLSVGVGGSSVIRVTDGRIAVGPESVGSVPGPACFALGGQEATITDAFLVAGLLDPETFFDGGLALDAARASAAVAARVGDPLGLDAGAAAQAMETAWVAAVARALRTVSAEAAGTTLAAFGGAGPFVVCKIAEALGISQVIIPALAPVFSAFGIGFSDIGHRYEAVLEGGSADALERAREDLRLRARRDMFAEGFALEDCALEFEHVVNGAAALRLRVRKPIAHARFSGRFDEGVPAARSAGVRRVRAGALCADLPLYRTADQRGGGAAAGPAVLEDPFFTCRIDAGWGFEINMAGDILLRRARGTA